MKAYTLSILTKLAGQDAGHPIVEREIVAWANEKVCKLYCSCVLSVYNDHWHCRRIMIVIKACIARSILYFYAFTQHSSVAGGVMFLSCFVLHASHNVNTISWKVFDRYSLPKLTYVSNEPWDNDERFTFWVQKVKVQGHGGFRR